MGDPVTPAETIQDATSPLVSSEQLTGSPARSAARRRSKRRRATAPREREQLARQHLAERAELEQEPDQVEDGAAAPAELAKPLEPVDPEKTRAACEGYVRAALCGLNLLGARFMGSCPLDASDYHPAKASITEELAAMCPDGLARSLLFRGGGFAARFLAKHLERLTGVDGSTDA